MHYSTPEPIEIRNFSSEKLEDGSSLLFMLDGFEANAEDSGWNYMSFDIPFDCRINGIQTILKNHSFGDYMFIEIGYIDPQDPSKFIQVKKFGRKYKANDEIQDQGWIKSDYSAKIPEFIAENIQTKLRVNYFRKNASIITNCIFNLNIHKIIP